MPVFSNPYEVIHQPINIVRIALPPCPPLEVHAMQLKLSVLLLPVLKNGFLLVPSTPQNELEHALQA